MDGFDVKDTCVGNMQGVIMRVWEEYQKCDNLGRINVPIPTRTPVDPKTMREITDIAGQEIERLQFPLTVDLLAIQEDLGGKAMQIVVVSYTLVFQRTDNKTT